MSNEVESPRKWQPLNPRMRRVLGVLVEKAKTTPDAYPMTLNGIVTGCNQKTNRDPVTNYSEEDVEAALEELRQVGVVAEVQGTGRVPKYRHYAYDWLGVTAVEMAVMTELLLRGEQTVGELRGRAARMEPIADLNALKPVLESLKQKQLVLDLSPPGRGQVVSHNLYKERELPELKARYANYVASDEPAESRPAAAPAPPASPLSQSAPRTAASLQGISPPAPPPGVTRDMFNELQVDVAELRAEVARLRDQVRNLEDKLSQVLS
jgi:uncharacterized protein YceH (UPF0502 family)